MKKIPNFAGMVRRSQMVTTYGPGAIINLRSPEGAPISALTAGLDSWDTDAKPAGLKNPQRCYLSRLQKKLKVNGFRLPPVFNDRASDDRFLTMLVAQRFPDWLTCPKCFKLKPSKKWAKSTTSYEVARWCPDCSTSSERTYVVPVRFVLTCPNGHLAEFPWSWWLSNFNIKKDVSEPCQKHNNLRLRQGDSMSLSSLFLICEDCGCVASMGKVFNPAVFKNISCSGHRPWLGSDVSEQCEHTYVAVQRNSSSLYFAKYESAIDIPPWTHTLEEQLGDDWPRVYRMDDYTSRGYLIEALIEDINNNCNTNYAVAELNDKIQELKDLDENSNPNLRVDEYNQFTSMRGEVNYKEFSAREEMVSGKLTRYLAKVVRVERLREVRANIGFSRLSDNNPTCKISVSQKDWLPAIEVRGEGIFIELNADYVNSFISEEKVQERLSIIMKAHEQEQLKRGSEDSEDFELSPKFVLVHTISHLLIQSIAQSSGYSASSLRERLYVSENMQGVLIYTATSDSEGTLGGLSRIARQDNFEKVFIEALNNAAWCSSDPLCIEGSINHSEPMNLAACHSCLMLPETSCEFFNLFLDRALICGDEMSDIPAYNEGFDEL